MKFSVICKVNTIKITTALASTPIQSLGFARFMARKFGFYYPFNSLALLRIVQLQGTT